MNKKNFAPDPGELKKVAVNAIEKNGDICLSLDLNREMPKMRPMHGVTNFAPLQNSAMTCNYPLLTMVRDLKIPYSYFHDTPLENPGLDLIDVSRIFPIFSADVNNPENYRFEETDAYLQQVIDSGTEVIFRLGESIEVTPAKRFRVNPPADFEKWAEICLHIVSHYTEGWANGFHWNIRDWAVWEEPNNPNLWGGTFEQYLRLYEVTAVKFKKRFPNLRIGGPESTTFGIKYLEQFLAFCEEKKLPLDFVCYTAYYQTPAEILAESFVRRKMVDDHGFKDIPLWMDEWHGSPLWDSFPDEVGYMRESNRIRGYNGAVFAGTVLCGLQDVPAERACYYSVCMPGGYGLFDERRIPTPQYYMFAKYCSMFNNAKRRIAVDFVDDEPNVKALACEIDEANIEMMLGCYLQNARTIKFSIPDGFKLKSVEIMNANNARFVELNSWDYSVADNVATLQKNELPMAFFVKLQKI
ncbi:MAG: hypothetical protein IJW31_02615 [Lentisphaeria bacterium]|nr:hypothetical protein [Lentisphaeria bacterium]